MAALRDEVRQDAASLHRFLCTIADQCERRSGAAAYLESSERFFAYVLSLAKATKDYLQVSVDARTSPQESLDLRKEIATLRAGWRFLHEFIKPVVDADTLRLPTALIQGLIKRFGEIQAFSDVDFVVYHTDQFNYFNVKLGVFKPRANKIADLVGGPHFPEKLGIIGIPYSQASSLFLNCLIPHEMGHYAFGALNLGRKFRAQIEHALTSCSALTISVDERLQLVELLAFWIEEIFCDSFAVRLVGFCFSLAFVELFDVATVLDEKGDYASGAGSVEFHQYPPDLYRLRQQISVLKSDGWWEPMQTLNSHYAQTLRTAEQLDDAVFICPQLTFADPTTVLKVFFSLMPALQTEVGTIASDLKNYVDIWKEQRLSIQEYLENGVVPSTLTRTDGAPNDIPNLVTLLNASFEFYIQSLDKLLSNIEATDVQSIKDRSYWVNRIETWAAKAIEDSTLLNQKV